jgi:hypothetical protein
LKGASSPLCIFTTHTCAQASWQEQRGISLLNIVRVGWSQNLAGRATLQTVQSS